MRIIADPTLIESKELRQARRDSGHGCIRCGSTVYLYCIFELPAREPRLGLICLPCHEALFAMPNRDRVLAVLLEAPLARQRSFDDRHLPYMRGFNLPDTRFPVGSVMRKTVFPIVFGGAPVVGLEPPEEYDGPLRLSVRLGDGTGEIHEIVRQNLWLDQAKRWSFSSKASRYEIESDNGEAFLTMAFPGDQTIEIEQLRTIAGPHILEIDGNGVKLDGDRIVLPASDSQLVGLRVLA